MTVDHVQVEKSVREAYAPGRLPFCHDEKYELRRVDRPLCALGEAEVQRCPALKKSCRLTPPPHEAKEPKSEFAVPVWVATLAEGLLWLLLVAAAVGVLSALIRAQRARRSEDNDPTPADAEDKSPLPAAAPAAPAETDVQRLLSQARQAAERGELGPAIDAAHAAAMQGLSAAGQIELERDRTNGDYLRELRKAPPLYQDFQVIVGQVEALQFGGAEPTRRSFDQVLERVTSMLRRLAVLSSLLLLAGCGASAGARVETQETSPSGLFTFKRLLVDQGANLHTRVEPLGNLEDVSLIVAVSTELEQDERDVVLRWVESGGVLVSVGTPDFDEAGGVERRWASCGRRAQPISDEGWEGASKLAVLGERILRVVETTALTHTVQAECGGEPYIVTASLGAGAIRFIPEAELLTNASLSVADNASLVAQLVQFEPGDAIELVGPWTGKGSQSPIQSLQAAGMMPFMLQLLGLGVLLALRQGTSFGARRDDTRRERRAFADHVRAVASTYHRARAGHLVTGHYALLLLEQLRERLFPGQSPTLLQLASGVARRTSRPEPQVVELLVEAKGALDQGVEGAGVNHKLIVELEQLSSQVGGVS